MNVTEARRLLGLSERSRASTAFKRYESRVRRSGQAILTGDADSITDEFRSWIEATEALNEVVKSIAEVSQQDSTTSGAPQSREPTKVAPSVTWPSPLSEDRARTRLQAWARERRRVPDTAFNGRLNVGDDSIGRYTVLRLLETRSETPEEQPGAVSPKVQGAYSGHIDAVLVKPPIRIENQRLTLLKQGSVKTATCSSCYQGQARCNRCGGSGQVSCRTTERCRTCSGSGSVYSANSQPGQTRKTCPSCHGRGSIACHTCRGSGFLPCSGCASRGYVPCERCRATGTVTTFVLGRIDRTVRSKVIGGVARGTYLAKASTEATWQRWTFEDAVIPNGLPASDVERIEAALQERQKTELLRDLIVEILPITKVEYVSGKRGAKRNAYLVGKEQLVVAGGAPTTARFKAAIAIPIVSSLIVVILNSLEIIQLW